MINDIYQLINELECNELYVLRNREHFRNRVTKIMVENKCGF